MKRLRRSHCETSGKNILLGPEAQKIVLTGKLRATERRLKSETASLSIHSAPHHIRAIPKIKLPELTGLN
jgi:hypothetical protein